MVSWTMIEQLSGVSSDVVFNQRIILLSAYTSSQWRYFVVMNCDHEYSSRLGFSSRIWRTDIAFFFVESYQFD